MHFAHSRQFFCADLWMVVHPILVGSHSRLQGVQWAKPSLWDPTLLPFLFNCRYLFNLLAVQSNHSLWLREGELSAWFTLIYCCGFVELMLVLRCIHTMPRGRMQHTAALPRGKSCSPVRSRPHEKKNFLQTFRLPKLWNEIGKLVLIFSPNWLIPFWNTLLIICCVASFDGTDNLPIEFLGYTASNGMPQPSRHNVHVYLWHGATFAAWPCRTLPLCAVRHSVDVPLWWKLSRFWSKG